MSEFSAFLSFISLKIEYLNKEKKKSDISLCSDGPSSNQKYTINEENHQLFGIKAFNFNPDLIISFWHINHEELETVKLLTLLFCLKRASELCSSQNSDAVVNHPILSSLAYLGHWEHVRQCQTFYFHVAQHPWGYVVTSK